MDLEDLISEQKACARNFVIGGIILILIAIFAPDRYVTPVFLGAIWAVLLGISGQLTYNGYVVTQNSKYLLLLAQKAEKDLNDDFDDDLCPPTPPAESED